MSRLVLVLGDASSGKTTSYVKSESLNIVGLPPDKTAVIDVIGKGLPTKGWRKLYNAEKKNYRVIHDAGEIMSSLDRLSERKDIKYIVIDDYQFILASQFIDDIGAGKTKGNEIFDRYNQIVYKNKRIFDAMKNCRQDQIVFCICHSERIVSKNGFSIVEKMKTIGQATDKFLTPEGMTDTILFAVSEMDADTPKKYFLTQTDGEKMARSPADMFKEMKIKNDLNYVVQCIEEYDKE